MKSKNNEELWKIRGLIGDATSEQLRYVDSFVTRDIGLFMPVGGACFYALTPEHTHPSYMFVLNFDDRTSVRMDNRTITGTHGTVSALSPGIPHQELPSDTPPRYICIMIDRGFFEEQYRSYSCRKPPKFRYELFPPGPDLLPALKRFMIEAEGTRPGSEAVRRALGVEICHSLIRSLLRTPVLKDRLVERVEVNRVIEHLHDH